MSLYRITYETETWTTDGTPRTVRSQVADSWLVRSTLENPFEFKLMGAIARAQDYRSVLEASGNPKFELPLVYAAAPRCIALGEEEIICAIRGSADDDDGNRKLDPTVIFHSPLDSAPEIGDFLYGSRIVSGIYSPVVDPTKFYVPRNNVKVPPLLIAKSRDGGLTWKRKFVAPQGGIDAHLAYLEESNLLVLAYGGWTYPRRGVVVQWSRDKGETWSPSLIVSDEKDHFTTGTVYLAKTGLNRILLVYDSLARYIEYDYTVTPIRPIRDGHEVRYRFLEF